jgi:hypothetical protein
LHPENGEEPVRNMVLYGRPEASADAPLLGLAADNVVVRFELADGVDTLHIEVINFEAPLFAPWWPGLAHKLMNPRPVSMTVPVAASAPTKTAAGYPGSWQP